MNPFTSVIQAIRRSRLFFVEAHLLIALHNIFLLQVLLLFLYQKKLAIIVTNNESRNREEQRIKKRTTEGDILETSNLRSLALTAFLFCIVGYVFLCV